MNTRTLFGPLGIAIISIGVCVIALLVQAPPLLGALLSPDADPVDNTSQVDDLKAEHDAATELHQDRYLGRSAFYLPTRPVVPVIPQDPGETVVPDDDFRSAPNEYGGTLRPSWSLGNTVMFKRGATGPEIAVKVGETNSGVRVVEINAPWSVKVAWTKPAMGHISYEEGIYDIRFWNDSTQGDNPPLLSEVPDNPDRLNGLAGGGLSRSPLQTPGNRTPGRRGPTRFDDDEDEDEEDREDPND